jgi:hypothetical protein
MWHEAFHNAFLACFYVGVINIHAVCVKVNLWKEFCLTSIDVENQHQGVQNVNWLYMKAAEEDILHLHIRLPGQRYTSTNRKHKVD